MIPDVDTLRERARRRTPARLAVVLVLVGALYVAAEYATYRRVDSTGLWYIGAPLIALVYIVAVVVLRHGSPVRISAAAGLSPADRWRVTTGVARGRLDPDPRYRDVQFAEVERLGASAGAWPIWIALAAVHWGLFALSGGDGVQWTSAVTALLFSGLATYLTALRLGMRRIERQP